MRHFKAHKNDEEKQAELKWIKKVDERRSERKGRGRRRKRGEKISIWEGEKMGLPEKPEKKSEK